MVSTQLDSYFGIIEERVPPEGYFTSSTDTSLIGSAAGYTDIYGGAGIDKIIGAGGSGTIQGNKGADIITLAAGSEDDIEFNLIADAGDVVSGFVGGSEDMIGLQVHATETTKFSNNIKASANTDLDVNQYGELTVLSASAQDAYGATSTTGTGIVVVGAATGTGGVSVYYTSDITAATVDNSTLIVTLTGINTAGISDTDFATY